MNKETKKFIKETNKTSKEKLLFINLKLMCEIGKATAGTFENYIKKYGLTMNVILLIMVYYKDDYKNDINKYDLRRFKK